jgi:hypothetical protein
MVKLTDEQRVRMVADLAAAHLGRVGIDTTTGLRAATRVGRQRLLAAIHDDPRFQTTVPPPGVKANANCWTLAEEPQKANQTNTDEQATDHQ